MRFIATLIAATTLFAVAFAAPKQVRAAASECKGLVEANCKGNKICSWVKAHNTTKGKQISAFCRKRPERKKATEAATAPKS